MDGSDVIIIFDTTLRDGEQSPGATLNIDEKLEIAHQLARLGVDVIEAGFPIASPGDFEAVRRVAREVGQLENAPIIAGLARASKGDIDRAWDAVREAKRPRIHTFLATSDIHLTHKLKISREECIKRTGEAVAHARSLCADVEFSPEDAGRSDPEFLYQVLEVAIKSGATTLNIPDTTGYTLPSEFGGLIRGIRENVPGAQDVIISAHCHDDLGLATANSLAAIQNGARQVEVIVMTLHTRPHQFSLRTHIDTTQIVRTSRLVSAYTGIAVQANKAIVGANAFAHESGIHQDGMLKNPLTYEIMRPETVGLSESKLVLGKHSGRHAFQSKVAALGYGLSAEDLNRVFERFKELCDKKKVVADADIEAIVNDEIYQPMELWRLEHIQVSCGSGLRPTATVTLRGPDGVVREDAAIGTGPVDSVYRAINRIVQVPNELTEFSIKAVTEGIDAVGEVTIRIEPDAANGANGHGEGYLTQAGLRARTYSGHGADTDIIVASAKAYMSALNKMLTIVKAQATA
ncbi:MAG: 2-isopropylmalate synthase [Anaerolineae bacterium]|nr:2-isopropylmalate synthase [Anaerolineae bacterium]